MLQFSAPLGHVCVRALPWQSLAGRVAAWLDNTGAAALLSDGGPHGRYSYLLHEPDAMATLDDRQDVTEALRQAMAFVDAGARPDGLPPFSGGLLGLASFELGLRLEGMKRRAFHLRSGRIEGRETWPELTLLRFPAVLAFDHLDRTLTIVGRGATPQAAEAARDRLMARFEATPARAMPDGPLAYGPLQLETPDGVHEDKVAALIQQIHAGDLFQANLARGWTGALRPGIAPGDVLAALAAQGPAPFGAGLNLGDRAVISNSPERFIRLSDDATIETRPIKGTRPRGRTPEADRQLAADLLASEKDRAENLMIVDLMRHDLSKVAEVGSVKVTALNALESYPNVHHLVSSVTARLRPGLTAADLLAATFPPGSISGAPKVQAMKVINDMEAARGPYCGALFTIDAGGAMESSVLIRTLAMERDDAGRWSFRAAAGGGIVADSDPREERIETETKLSLIKAVLEGS